MVLERIDQLSKETADLDIQTQTSQDFFASQPNQEVYENLVKEHEQRLRQQEVELSFQKEKLADALNTIDEQKKSLTLKEKTVHEQLEEIEQLASKIKELEDSLSETKDICESQKELLEKHEAKIKEQQTHLEEHESQVSQNTDKFINIEKDLRNKEEQFKEKVEELAKLKVDSDEITQKYGNIKHEYAKLKKENEMLVEKAASLHMNVEELTKKNQKYKKQLIYLQEEQQKKIENLKEQRVNDEMEIIKYKSLLEEKEKFLNKLLNKDISDSKDIRMIVEESYKKISDYEKSIIEQDFQRKLSQQKEEQEKELETTKAMIAELEEKYSKAKHKIHEMKNDLIMLQQKKAASESKKFKDEKAIIIKTLNDKNKKIDKLEKEVESWKIKYSGLENFLSEDQKVAYSKLQTLTKNMNQLKQMYSQIVSSESVKQEKHVLEKKLKRKERKIEHIEHELSTTREQVVNLKNQVHMLYTQLSQYTKVKDKGVTMLVSNLDQTINPEVLQPNKGIVKSRKGGKNLKKATTLSFNQLMQMSALNRDKSATDEIREQDDEDDQILEQDDEYDDDEEEKI